MRTTHHRLMPALTFFFASALQAVAQAPAALPPNATRFTIAAAPLLSLPKGEFRQNVGNNAFGGGGALLYRLDRNGWLSVRFDGSGMAYGREEKEVPFSQGLGQRVLVEATTTNSIFSVAIGPEIALPRGPVRPYFNAAFSGLFFRTSTSVMGDVETLASTTNHSDNTSAWVFGTGVRIPLPRRDSPFSLDFGVRYHRGGPVSYLREGSIEDLPDGSISITPLNTRTPYVAYLIGVRFNIPFNSPGPCPRFLC